MLIQEQAVEIRVMARHGLSIRAIARQTGLSRQAVRKYLIAGVKPAYAPRKGRPTNVDSVKTYLVERIAAAKPDWIPASVLYREACERGYSGAQSTLRAFVAQFKPKTKADPVVRFETEPGVQMQADFTFIRRGRDPLIALVATLGFSRATYVRFVTSEDAVTLAQCLRLAFEYFGGVPHHVLFDNAKSVVIERDVYGAGKHRWNDTLLSLADQYGFTPRVCRPYRARTKGKVERFNGYLKPSFVIPLTTTLRQAGLTLDCATANAHVGPWLAQVANARTHGTTQERPCDRLVIERTHLLALPVIASHPVVPLKQSSAIALPIESLQHPLAVYQQLLAEAA